MVISFIFTRQMAAAAKNCDFFVELYGRQSPAYKRRKDDVTL